MRSRHRCAAAVIAIAALGFAAGCDEIVKDVRGDATTYSFAGWQKDVFTWGCVLAAPVGWKIWGWRKRIGEQVAGKVGLTLLATGPVCLLLVAPELYVHLVRVDARHVEARYGNWWAPYRHNIPFDDVARIEYHVELRPGPRGDTKVDGLGFVRKSGRFEKVYLSQVVKAAAPEILARAKRRGIPVKGFD